MGVDDVAPERERAVSVRVSVLGGFDARLASGAPLALPAKKSQALLAYLSARPGAPHRRDKLAALLWGDRGDDHARGALRHALGDLRKALDAAPGTLVLEGQMVAVSAERVDVDAARFERDLDDGTPEALARAVERYRGDLLHGFVLSEPLFEEWLVAERERLRERALDALSRLLAEQSRGPATEPAIQTAVRLVALDPLQESAHRALMRLYARQGRRGAALKQYQACVTALRRELGTEPEAETRRLHQELLRGHDAHGSSDREPTPAAPRPEALVPDLPATETPLFGRQAELSRLEALLDHAIHGHGRVVTVVGEAGIGKTELVSTLAAAAASRACRVLIGRCHDSDSILPFGPWVDACRGGRISADEALLAALHPTRRAELTRLLPEAGAPGLPVATDGALPLFESVALLIGEVAARQPLLLVLEDLHWADETSLRLLAFVSRRVREWPVLLVATARDEELVGASMARATLDELPRAARAVAMSLAPLSRADTARLVRALARVGSDGELVARAERRIWAMSEGNPFVAVEAMRALDDEGADGAPLAMPARVRDLVARRLDRLGAGGQHLAAVAAVIGRGVDFALLHAASGMDERAAAEAVDELVRHRVLRAVGDALDFAHDRIREVAYGRLLPPRRRLLHRAVVDALERAGLAQSDERVEQLAHHALRGELWDTAAGALRRAGAAAAARSALVDARARFGQALDALGAVPSDRARIEQAFEIHLELRPVLIQLGEFRQALDHLRAAEALAERLDDDGRHGRVSAFLANLHARLGEPDAAIASGTRALEVAERLGDLRLRIVATTYLAQAYSYRGDYARVVALTTDNLAVLPPEWTYEFFGSSQPPAINDRFRLLVSLAHLGRFDEAAAHEAEIVRLAERTGHAYTVALAHHAAGTLHLLRGDWARACAHIDQQLAALRTGNIAGELPSALAQSARALAHLGDAKGATERLDECEALLGERTGHASAAGARRSQPDGWTTYALSRACLTLGRVDDARRLGRDLGDAPSGRTDFVPYALHLLGDIASASGRADAASAEAYYRRALSLAEARGMRPLVAHCHLGLGRVIGRRGERRSAAEMVAAAVAMYREMDVADWLDQATTSLLGLV